MNKNIYEAPLVLFLGAGASKPLGLKTTPEFWEWFRKISNFDIDLLNAIAHPIKPSEENSWKVDIEAVLDILEKISEANKLKMAIYDYPSIKHLKSVVRIGDDIQESVIAIKDKIKDLVVEHYSAVDTEKCVQLYHQLLSKLVESQPLVIFTTNYDLAIEKLHEGGRVELTDGFNRDKYIKPIWSRDEYDYYQPSGGGEDVVLFKLHGSVDWVSTPQGIQRVDIPTRNPGGAKTVIAYPSRLKKEIHEEPFRTNYDYLIACLLHAKLCVVIGFSFRDQEIVEELHLAMELNDELELMIIDPKADEIKKRLQSKLDIEGYKLQLPNSIISPIIPISEEFTPQNAPSIVNRIQDKLEEQQKER